MKHLKVILIAFILLSLGFKSPGMFTYTKIMYYRDNKKLMFEISFYNQHLDDLMSKLTGKKTVFDMNNRMHRFELWEYLRKNFKIQINGKPSKFVLRGSYSSGDQKVIILEVNNVNEVRSLKIKNSLLFDLYPREQNLIEFLKGNRKFQEVASLEKPEVGFFIIQ